VRCNRAGKYDANRDHTDDLRRNSERWLRVPEVDAFEVIV